MAWTYMLFGLNDGQGTKNYAYHTHSIITTFYYLFIDVFINKTYSFLGILGSLSIFILTNTGLAQDSLKLLHYFLFLVNYYNQSYFLFVHCTDVNFENFFLPCIFIFLWFFWRISFYRLLYSQGGSVSAPFGNLMFNSCLIPV